MNNYLSRTLTVSLLGLALTFGNSGQAADDGSQDVVTKANGQAAKKSGRDAVAAAFRLPSGTVLNKQQRTALEHLKSDNEDDLRQAFAAMSQAKTGAERNKALQDIRDVRATIRTGLDNILSMGHTSNNGNANSGSGSVANSGNATSYGASPDYGSYYAANAGYYGSSGYGGYGYYYPYRPYRYWPYLYNHNGSSTMNRPSGVASSGRPASGSSAKRH